MWGLTSTATGVAVVAAGGAAVLAVGMAGPGESAASGGRGGASAEAERDAMEAALKVPHNFYFARAQYSDDGLYPGWKDWRTDYPKADRQFMVVLKRLASLDVYERETPVRLDDPLVRRFPFLYAVEVGRMQLTPEEAAGLREYLLAGGFLVADDFWGTLEWRRFEEQMKMVFPEHTLVDVPQDHPLFHAYYDVDEVVQVPNVGQGMQGGPTHESDGYEPRVRGLFDDAGRLMVVANWNTDLGDGWEWAENPRYPLEYSTYAYRMGVNFIVYAMSH